MFVQCITGSCDTIFFNILPLILLINPFQHTIFPTVVQGRKLLLAYFSFFGSRYKILGSFPTGVSSIKNFILNFSTVVPAIQLLHSYFSNCGPMYKNHYMLIYPTVVPAINHCMLIYPTVVTGIKLLHTYLSHCGPRYKIIACLFIPLWSKL